MRALVDNNLPLTMVRRIRALGPSIQIQHISELGCADATDEYPRKFFVGEQIVWISRDEDFWMKSPENWSVIWISLHNPRLSFLCYTVAPILSDVLVNINASERILISEDGIVKFGEI